jgi:hypothetical protein
MRTSGGGRHAAHRKPRRWRALMIAMVLLVGVGVAAAVALPGSSHPSRKTAADTSRASGSCTELTVVTASSFAPVVRSVASPLATGKDCVKVRLRVADGQAAAAVAADADVWIPDDASWPQLAHTSIPESGGVLATSPLYVVTQRAAPPLPAASQSWLGLAHTLASSGTKWRLRITNPAGSGDGMVAGAALADAMYFADGALTSALDLFRAWQHGSTATSAALALPVASDQASVIPEHALLASGHIGDYRVYAPRDGTAELRYVWVPAAAEHDSLRLAALSRLHAALTGPAGTTALSAAGLRNPAHPTVAPPAAAAAGLPQLSAPVTAVVPEHMMYHVLATWRPSLRTSNMLIVIDVSWSMSDPAPGTPTSKIVLVRQGMAQVLSLLPNSARLGLWQFGSQLQPPDDWQSLAAPAALTPDQRAAVGIAGSNLKPLHTGTGLYDTILGAYRYQQAHYQAGMPNEVVVFTDGVNEDDPDTITLTQLRAGLAATDRGKRVQLSVFGIGKQVPADRLQPALAPVGGQVDLLTSPTEVIGAFVHAVSGALSGVPG